MASRNLELLEQGARILKPLLPELVFVGGCITELLVTEPSALPLRATDDIDVIIEVASYADYVTVFSERLHRLGLSEDDRPRAPRCRWVKNNLAIDVMPVNSAVLGFSNRWYADGIKHSLPLTLPSGTRISILQCPYFLATKVEAFLDRGKGDYYASHDLEDILTVVDGRESCVQECLEADEGLRTFLAAAFRRFLTSPDFSEALHGVTGDDPGQLRYKQAIGRFKRIAGLIP